MQVNTTRAMAVAMALFLCPVPSRGMESVDNISQEENYAFPYMKDEYVYYAKTINTKLQRLEEILKAHLGTDRTHKIRDLKSGIEVNQCKLSGLQSPLISGNVNSPLRDDLRVLLYKPWTDPYYSNHLSQKDFSLISILGSAIKQEPIFDNQREAFKITKRLQKFAPQQVERQNSDNEDPDKPIYRDLFYRRHLHELGELFKRCDFLTRDGRVDFAKIPELYTESHDFREKLRLTFAKAHMMHMLTAEDLEKLQALQESLITWDDFSSTFDTYAQKRILKILNEVIQSLNAPSSTLTVQDMVAHCLSKHDYKQLANYQENLSELNGITLSTLTRGLQKSLMSLLNRDDYLDKFQFYRDRPLWRLNHENILQNIKGGSLKTMDLVDFFTELSQLKVSLNSLGDERDRSVVWWTKNKEKMSMSGKIDWSQVPEKVRYLKREIELIQSKILEELEKDGKLFVENLIENKMRKEQEESRKLEEVSEKEEIWILAMDGGGVRGKIAAEILRDLSAHLQHLGLDPRLSNLFDFVGGTSVGGLIAQALNLPGDGLEPSVSEDYIAKLLDHEQASVIFPSLNGWYKGFSQFNSFAYDSDPFESFLLANFGFTALEEMRKPTMVVAHDAVTQEPVGIKSFDKRAREVKAACSARGTTAASSYFAGITLCIDGKLRSFVDGGMTANNPGYYSLHEFLQTRQFGDDGTLKRINVLSIGTGQEMTDKKGNPDTAGVTEVIEHSTNGGIKNNVTTDHTRVISELGGCHAKGIEVNYYRLNPLMEQPIELDSASEENIAKLRTLVYESILSSPLYSRLVAHLAGDQGLSQNKYIDISGKERYSVDQFSPLSPYLSCMRKAQC